MTQKKDASGNGIWRYVGPQDCVPNSRLRIVFACNRVWITDIRFGISLIAKEIWIKPPPPPTVQKLEGVRIVAKVDVANAIKLLNTMQTTEANLDEDAFDDDGTEEQHPSGPTTTVPVAPPATSSPPDDEDKKSPEPKRRKKEPKEPKPTVVADPL
jgi:hypothetical protein